MNTIQLTSIMKCHPATKQLYLGTFSVDNLPKKVVYPSCLIFNNQPSTLPGQHWIAVYFSEKRKSEFFDSLGKSPSYYGIEDYLKLHSIEIIWSERILQSNNSEYCGFYCLLFLICRCKSRSLKYFLNLFDKAIINDKTFDYLLKKYY